MGWNNAYFKKHILWLNEVMLQPCLLNFNLPSELIHRTETFLIPHFFLLPQLITGYYSVILGKREELCHINLGNWYETLVLENKVWSGDIITGTKKTLLYSNCNFGSYF